jgi:hypothetical protein
MFKRDDDALETYGPVTTGLLFLFDLFLIIEAFGIVFWGSDPFNIVPQGATHTETILFALGLFIWGEIIGLKYGVFSPLGRLVREKRQGLH